MTILPLIISVASLSDPFGYRLTRPDGVTFTLVCHAEGYSPTPIKSPFREWADGLARFLVETSREAPSVLILRLYEAKQIQIGIRWPRTVEAEDPGVSER